MSIIDKRQSIRVFNQVEIKEEELVSLVQAGMTAPSSKNNQPWQYMILDHQEIIQQFAEFHPNWKVLRTAPAVIIVCGDLERDSREIHTVMACAAATQNILLRAVELGIGAVWLGLYPDQERIEWTKYKLNMPEKQIPLALIAVGYTDDMKKQKDRAFDNNRIHRNRW